MAWAVALVGPEEIDRMNILNASIEAMHRALRQLSLQPGAVAVDGNRFKPYGNVPWRTFVRATAASPTSPQPPFLPKPSATST